MRGLFANSFLLLGLRHLTAHLTISRRKGQFWKSNRKSNLTSNLSIQKRRSRGLAWSLTAYSPQVKTMRRGPPKNGAGWYGPYHPVVFCCPCVTYPNYVPQRVTLIQTEPMPGVIQQWGNLFKSLSRDGVPSDDRHTMVWDFDQVDPSGSWYSSVRLESDPGLIGGYFSQRWTLVYGLSTIPLAVNYLWGPRTTAPQFQPCRLDCDELLDGVETNLGINVGLFRGQVRPANWNLYS